MAARFRPRWAWALAASVAAGAAAFLTYVPARATALQAPGGGQVRALAIGVNDYRAFRPLRGAVADAQDLAGTLRKLGAQDVTLLTDAGASRDAVMAAADALTKRIGRGDLVIVSIAGHGAQEPEKVKGSEPDGNEEVFLLAGFDPATGPGSRERVLDKEFNVLVKRMEEKGATVVFVADACHGGGLAREADPRGAELSYRQVPRFAISDDELKPIVTEADAFLTQVDFERSVFLGAVDKFSKAPEVKIPDVPGWRGALSYAVARAAEGAADADKDGQVTLAELYAYVRQVAYQLTDQRQNVVTINAPALDMRKAAVFRSA
ncbi:caspase family protein, partial [Nostoc sp. NIES-2111]